MITCRPVPVSSADARELIREYATELVDRYHGRAMGIDFVASAMAAEPDDDLGTFLVAYRQDASVGCVGLRPLSAETGEVKRMYVRPAVRRLGVGRLLLDAVEDEARRRGWRELRLDTRADLSEARALYTRHGYAEIPRYNDNPWAQHWYAKPLPPPTSSAPVAPGP